VGIRVYFCPIVGDGLTTETAFRAKLAGLVPQVSASIPHNPDGTPKFNWALAVARATSWSVVNADAALERIFGIDLPDTIETWAELKAFLQSKTVGDIPLARRQALNDKLTARGIDTSQVRLQTTWWQVLRGIVRHLNDGVLPSGDGIGIA
jgi:hypothetical protein